MKLKISSLSILIIFAILFSICGETKGVGNTQMTEDQSHLGTLKIKIDVSKSAYSQSSQVWAYIYSGKSLFAVSPRETYLSSGTSEFTVQTPDDKQLGTNVNARFISGNYVLFVYLDETGDEKAGFSDYGYKKKFSIHGDKAIQITAGEKDSDFDYTLAVAVTIADIIPHANCRPVICRFSLSGGDPDTSSEVIAESKITSAYFTSSGLTTTDNSAIVGGTYDLDCIMDLDGNGIKSAGDYEYSKTGVEFSEDSYSIKSGSFEIYEDESGTTISLSKVGEFDSFGNVTDIDILDDIAYVSDGTSGLLMLDVEDPTSISILGRYNTSGTALKSVICGDYAFVADSGASDTTGGLTIIDISDPYYPDLVSSIDSSTIGNVSSVYIAGDYAYTATGTTGLNIIDISDPETPTSVGVYDNASGNNVNDVLLLGNYAYIAYGLSGVEIVDVTDPTVPALYGSISQTTLGTATDSAKSIALTLDMKYLMLANDAGGLKIIDINDPLNPALYSQLDTSGNALEVSLNTNYVFIADDTQGLQTILISNLSTPTLASSYAGNAAAKNALFAGNYLYLSEADFGFQILTVFAE
jgi:hypothetical protein